MADLRLFVAVLISDEIKKNIADVQDEFKDAASGVKWVAPENFHVTLKFLGNVDESKLESVHTALSSAVTGTRPFDLMVEGAGAFPSPSRPQVVWIGLGEGKEQVRGLAERVETELESAGFPKEDKKFKGHITIGRVKDYRDVRELPGVIQAHEKEDFGSFRVDRIALMKSDLRREGPVYSALREYELPGA